MKFLVDDHLPVALARALTAAGYEALHVLDCDLSGQADRAIWRRACGDGSVIVSKDEDFVLLHASRPPHARVLWLRMGNSRKRPLLAKVLPLMPDAVVRFERGEMVVEIC